MSFPSQSSQPTYKFQPTTIYTKIKDSILIITITTTTPYLLSIFHYPITKTHYTFLSLLTILSIIAIFSSSSQPNIIQQVFEANKIEINGKYPTLKGSKSNEK